MNDENDHDQGTEHIEKWGKKGGGGIFGASSTDSDSGADDASSTHNSTNGTANPKSGGKKIFSGWKKQGDGQVDEPEYEGGGGGKPKKKRQGFFQGTKDDRDYKDYEGLTKDDWYQGGNDYYNRDEVDEETGAPRWKAHYEELKRNKAERDAFAEEYRKHTGRDFNARDYWGGGAPWIYYSDAYGPQGNMRGEDGEIDWDRVNRGIAQTYLDNYARGRWNDEDLGWKNPEQYATFNDNNEDLDRFEDMLRNDYGVTDEQIQEAYRQVRETGQVDPTLFRGPDTSQQEAEQVAEAVEGEILNNGEGEGGAIFPGGTGGKEDGAGPRVESTIPVGGENGQGEWRQVNPSSAQASASGKTSVVTGDKPSITSQRMMDAGVAGLNMFGNVLGGANKAFSMLRGLASALTSRQLMSDPTLPARGFLNAMDQSGQIIEDHIRQVGEAYGIKDGVKREDLVGTYKGAQYYREKQRIEDAEKQYYAGVGNALSTVLGNNVNVNDPVSIQNALAQMGPAQLSQLDDALFGQNGTLRDMYDATVTNPTGSTKEQKARAQLFTTLNQALKGQAQANAREAGRTRTQTNQQIQQFRQQGRQLKDTDMSNYRQAQQQVANPASMAGMSGREQMRSIIHSAIGRRIMSGDIPMQRSANGQWGMLDTDKLDINALNAIKRTLEGGQIMNHPATQQAARQLYDEVQTKLNNARQMGVQFRQQQRQSRLAPFMDSPLEYDIEDKGGVRDRFGIPESSAGRRRLYNNAWYTMQDLMSKNGNPKDIALCENVMQMCDMADFREGLMNAVRDMEKEGSITPMEAELVRRNAERAYEEMASALPMTRAERDDHINKGQDWQRNQRTDAMYSNMQTLDGNLDNISRYHAQAERERRKEQEQAARDERMKPYQNSPVDLDINSGSKADRDSMGIPTDKGKRNKLYVKAQNMLRELKQNNGDQKDIDLCRNVMALCDLADRRDELTNTVRDLRKSGAISALEEEMYLDEANRYYDLASAELATTVDEREARIAAKEGWTENLTTGNMSTQMDNLNGIVEDIRTGFTNQERDRRRAQEQARREAQRTAEMEPYQNSPLDLDLMNGKGGNNRDRYHIPKTYSGQRNLRDNADDMIRTLIDEGGTPEDISLCENVRTLANAAMHRSEIESYLSKLEAKGKISKEEAELARQNAFRAYNDLANRLPVTVKDRDARIQAQQAWEQDDNTDNLSLDLETTMNHLKYLEGEYDTRVREDREAMREQRRRERAENKARAAENARQERDAKWEEDAIRDPRGISTASDPKYRKKDVQRWGDRLKSIETEMMDTRSPDTMLKLTKEKLDLETKIRQTMQEEHLQRLISKAGSLDPYSRKDIQDRVDALRDSTADWNEFGKALNDIYKDYPGIGSDRTWASTRKAEEALKKQAREDSRTKILHDILKAIQGSPAETVRLLGKSLADPKGDLNKGIDDILKKNNIDLKKQLLGTKDKRKNIQTAITAGVRTALGLKTKETLRGVLRDSFKENLTDVTDRLDSIDRTVADLNDDDKSGIIQAVNDMRGATDRLTDFVTDVFTINGKTGQYANINDMKNELLWMSNKNRALLDAINQKIPLGGIHTQQQSTVLDPDTLKALQDHAKALDNQSKRLDSLITKLDAKGEVTKKDLKELVQAIKEPIDSENIEGPDGSNDVFGGGVWSSEDDYNEFMNMVRTVSEVGGVIKSFMDGNVAQGLQPGLPVRNIDDYIQATVEQYLDEKLKEIAEEMRQSQTPQPQGFEERGGVFQPETDREASSETPTEAQEGPVVESSVSEEGQVDQSIVNPSEGTETATDGYEGEIYGENPYALDNQGRLDFAMEDWLNRLPHLKEYTKQHPDTLRYLSMKGPDGKTVHQILKDAIFRSFDQGLFEGQSASNIMGMMDEFLSQTSRDGLEQAVKEWKDLTDGQRLDPEKTRLQKGVIENIAGMAETALADVFREDYERRSAQLPGEEDVRTNGYAATDDLRRTMRIVANAMAEEAELRKKGLGEDQIKARMEQEDKAQKKASEQKAEDIVKDLDPQIGNVLAMNLRDKLFYSSRAPAWSDYRNILDSLGELREKYPGVVKDIDVARDDIVFGMIVPQLMGFKNIANVSPSDTLTKDKIEQISRRAMEIGLAKRQAVTDKNLANGGDISKLTDEDRHWLGFPTVDELVNSHVYGKDNDKDPVDIHRAKVRRQEKGNMYNNRLAEAYKMAAGEITLNDKVASELERIRQNSPYTGFMGQIGQIGQSAKNLTPAQSLWDLYNKKDGSLTIQDVNTALGSYRSAIANASKLKEDIGKHLDNNKIPVKVSNEYGEMDIPQDVIQQMNSARDTHRADSGMGDLDQFFGEGDISKQVLSLEALKEKMYEDGIMAKNGFDEATAKKVIDYARKAAKDSNKFEDHIDAAEKYINKEIKATGKQTKTVEEKPKTSAYSDDVDVLDMF